MSKTGEPFIPLHLPLRAMSASSNSEEFLPQAQTRIIHSSAGTPLRARLLAAGDESALRKFHDNLSPLSQSRFTPHGYDDPLLRRYVQRCQSGRDRSYVLLNGDDTVIGYFFLWQFTDPVPALGIGIADDWQAKGLGPQLIRILVEDARAADRDGIELTTVLDNEHAYALYVKLGFIYQGKVENVAGDGRVVVEKKLFLPLKEGARPSDRKFQPPA